MGMLQGKNVVLGVTGGIAAYKAAELASAMVKKGIGVYVIMTRHATEFVAPLTFETLTNHPVVVDMFMRNIPWEVEHISLAKRADAFLVAPASANFIGKLACGIADDMLSTTAMATTAPMVIAPAMNMNMYASAAVQENLATLQRRGAVIVPPGVGRLACGDVGPGRLADLPEILDTVYAALEKRQDLEGRTVLITAGPTREAIDPVRFLSNRSSGKMGYALAAAAKARGAQVLLISGPTPLQAPAGCQKIDVLSAKEMYDAVMDHYALSDLIIKAAAPADFTPKRYAAQKIKKVPGQDELVLELEKTPDIAAALGAVKGERVLVGFAAETQEVLRHAKEKLRDKNMDIIAVNDVSQPDAGFDVDTNRIVLLNRDGEEKALPLLSKREVADRILDEAIRYLA